MGDKAGDGTQLRPFIVWFGEAVPEIETAIQYVEKADIFVIIGTSLNVYPAAGFINYFKGSKLVIINKAATSADKNADLVISEPIGEVLGSLKI